MFKSLPDLSPGGKLPAAPRYRNLTERTFSLLFLLREIPYMTMKDIRRLFFPGNKSKAYSLEMTGFLQKNGLIARHLIGDGVFIYHLTSGATRILDFLIQENPRFHPVTKSFYYSKPPRNLKEVSPFFFFPLRRLHYSLFTPHLMHQHPYHHTAGLLDLYILFRNSFRVLYAIWLDHVESKRTQLSIPFNPDLLLTNDPFTEAGRIYVEFENSSMHAVNLLHKVNNISTMPADWFLVLCSSEEIFLKFGRNVRRILLGDAKTRQKTIFFSPRAQAVISRNLLIGTWKPAFRNNGEAQKLRTVELFRYDHEVFDKTIWVNAHENGLPVLDPLGKIPLKKPEPVPYPARKPGQRKWLLGEILDQYSNPFRIALQKALWKPSTATQDSQQKGATDDRP